MPDIGISYVEFRCPADYGGKVCGGIVPGPEVESLNQDRPIRQLVYCGSCRNFLEVVINPEDSLPTITVLPKHSRLPLVPFEQIFPIVRVRQA
jgi:hypothetical protein